MRRLTFGLALFFCLSAKAAGPLDGIYSCRVTVFGDTSQSYITVNGQPDGSSIFAVAAVSPSQSFFGYGIGKASGAVFSGETMFGLPFSMTVDPKTLTFDGKIGISLLGKTTTAAATCDKIY